MPVAAHGVHSPLKQGWEGDKRWGSSRSLARCTLRRVAARTASSTTPPAAAAAAAVARALHGRVRARLPACFGVSASLLLSKAVLAELALHALVLQLGELVHANIIRVVHVVVDGVCRCKQWAWAGRG